MLAMGFRVGFSQPEVEACFRGRGDTVVCADSEGHPAHLQVGAADTYI